MRTRALIFAAPYFITRVICAMPLKRLYAYGGVMLTKGVLQ